MKPTLRVEWKALRFSSGQDQAKYPSQRLPKNFHHLEKIWHGVGGRGGGRGGYKWIKAIWSIHRCTAISILDSSLSPRLIPGFKASQGLQKGLEPVPVSAMRCGRIHKNALHVIPKWQIYVGGLSRTIHWFAWKWMMTQRVEKLHKPPSTLCMIRHHWQIAVPQL